MSALLEARHPTLRNEVRVPTLDDLFLELALDPCAG
jgi:hypothetical protein